MAYHIKNGSAGASRMISGHWGGREHFPSACCHVGRGLRQHGSGLWLKRKDDSAPLALVGAVRIRCINGWNTSLLDGEEL